MFTDYQSENVRQLKRATWSSNPNHSVEYEYFTGPDAQRNPSGAKNLKKESYYIGTELKFCVNYNWNADNNIVKEYGTEI